MKHWINRNYKTLIITTFLVPIITVAIVSISHVTKWYGISNPVTWAIYLSIGVEIAALSALAAISANMGKKVYFPFAIVTLIQFIGNIFFAYSYIELDSKLFKDWVDLVSPIVEFIGIEPNDFIGHKRFLSLFAGGMLPIISLSFLHMLVKFTEEDRLKEQELTNKKLNEENVNKVEASDLISEVSRIRLSEKDLELLEKVLSNPPEPNDNLKNAVEQYKEKVKENELSNEKKTEIVEKDNGINEDITPANYISKEDIKLVLGKSFEEKQLSKKVNDQITDSVTAKKNREEILGELMEEDQKYGMYDLPPDNTPVNHNSVVPALSDEEVNKMTLDEWERKLDMEEEKSDDQEDWESYNKLMDLQSSTAPKTAEEMMITTNKEIIESLPKDDEKSDLDLHDIPQPVAIEELPENQPISDTPSPAIVTDEVLRNTVVEEKKKT